MLRLEVKSQKCEEVNTLVRKLASLSDRWTWETTKTPWLIFSQTNDNPIQHVLKKSEKIGW